MIKTTLQFEKILEFRETKSKQLKRPISFSEAIALWISESMKTPPKAKNKMGLREANFEPYIY